MRIAERAATFSFESAFELLSTAYRMESEGRDVVHLDLGEPDFPTPGHIVEAAEQALRAGCTHYTPAGGLMAAREAVADHVGRRTGVSVDPRQVVLTSGSVQALQFAMLALLEEGDEVLLSDPSYATYEALVQLAGARAVYVPLREDRDFACDLDELRSRIGPRTRLLMLNSPQNPTGASLDSGELQAIADLVLEHDLGVISDEVYSELVYRGGSAPSMLSVPGMAGRCVLVDSLSKTYAMCGWRLGFAVAPPAVATRLERIMLAAGLCAPAVAQAAAVEALTSPHSTSSVERMRAEFERRRDVMVGRLNRVPGIRCHVPAGAFYVFPSIRGTGMSDTQLAGRLLVEAGVAVLPGSSFGSRGAGHLRLSYATSMERIEEGLRRIEDVLTAPAAELRASA